MKFSFKYAIQIQLANHFVHSPVYTYSLSTPEAMMKQKSEVKNYMRVWVFGCLGVWVFGFLGFWVFGFLSF